MSLNRLQSTGPSIADLVDDILLDIFKLYRGLCFEDDNATLPRYAWLRVGHVCRRWRLLVENTPSMWNAIYLPCYEDLLSFALARSAQAPLTIMSGPKLIYGNALVPYLVPELHRLRSLELSLQEPFAKDFLDACASSPPSPFLTSLRLDFPDKLGDVRADGVLTRAGAPTLRSFSLTTSAGIVSSSLSFPSTLEELVLIQRVRTPWPVSDLFSMLAAAPRLTTLRLHRLLPLPDEALPTTSITFPFLESLFLKDTLPRAINFLSWIRTPALQKLTVDSATTLAGPLAPELAKVLHERLHDGGAAPRFSRLVYSEVAHQSKYDAVQVRLDTGSNMYEDGDDDDEVLTKPYVDVKFAPLREHRALLPALVGALPLGNVVCCKLDVQHAAPRSPFIQSDDDFAAWRTAFGGLVALEDLVITSDAWEHPDDHFLGRDGLRRFFPLLKGLQVGYELLWPLWPDSTPYWDANVEFYDCMERMRCHYCQLECCQLYSDRRRWQRAGIAALFRALPFNDP